MLEVSPIPFPGPIHFPHLPPGWCLPVLGSTGPRNSPVGPVHVHVLAQPPPELSQICFTAHLLHSLAGTEDLCQSKHNLGLCCQPVNAHVCPTAYSTSNITMGSMG